MMNIVPFRRRPTVALTPDEITIDPQAPDLISKSRRAYANTIQACRAREAKLVAKIAAATEELRQTRLIMRSCEIGDGVLAEGTRIAGE